MNQVQFQRGLSMVDLMDRVGSDDKYETALIASRSPKGVACPSCRCSHSSLLWRDRLRGVHRARTPSARLEPCLSGSGAAPIAPRAAGWHRHRK